jgi:hypothetical protein
MKTYVVTQTQLDFIYHQLTEVVPVPRKYSDPLISVIQEIAQAPIDEGKKEEKNGTKK